MGRIKMARLISNPSATIGTLGQGAWWLNRPRNHLVSSLSYHIRLQELDFRMFAGKKFLRPQKLNRRNRITKCP
jgi:hypothetical protein